MNKSNATSPTSVDTNLLPAVIRRPWRIEEIRDARLYPEAERSDHLSIDIDMGDGKSFYIWRAVAPDGFSPRTPHTMNTREDLFAVGRLVAAAPELLEVLTFIVEAPAEVNCSLALQRAAVLIKQVRGVA